MGEIIKKTVAAPSRMTASVLDKLLIDLLGKFLHRLPAGVALLIGGLLYGASYGATEFFNYVTFDDAWKPETQQLVAWVLARMAELAIVVEGLARTISARSGHDSIYEKPTSETKLLKEYRDPQPMTPIKD